MDAMQQVSHTHSLEQCRNANVHDGARFDERAARTGGCAMGFVAPVNSKLNMHGGGDDRLLSGQPRPRARSLGDTTQIQTLIARPHRFQYQSRACTLRWEDGQGRTRTWAMLMGGDCEERLSRDRYMAPPYSAAVRGTYGCAGDGACWN